MEEVNKFSEEVMALKEEVENYLKIVKQRKTDWVKGVYELGEIAYALRMEVKEGESGTTWDEFCDQFFGKSKNRINEAIADYRLQKDYPEIDCFKIVSVNRVQLSQALNSDNEEKKKLAERLIRDQIGEVNGEQVPLADFSSRQLRTHLNSTAGEGVGDQNARNISDRGDGGGDPKAAKSKKSINKKIETIEDYKKIINQTVIYFGNFGKQEEERNENVKQLNEIFKSLTGLMNRIQELLDCSKKKK